jgi:hypothetical protein
MSLAGVSFHLPLAIDIVAPRTIWQTKPDSTSRASAMGRTPLRLRRPPTPPRRPPILPSLAREPDGRPNGAGIGGDAGACTRPGDARRARSAGAGSGGARAGSTACKGTTSPGRAGRHASRPAVDARSRNARRAGRSTRRSPPRAPRATCAVGGRPRVTCRKAANPCATAAPPNPSGGTAAYPDRA